MLIILLEVVYLFGLGIAMVREFKRRRLTALKGLQEENLMFKYHHLRVVEQILFQLTS